MENEIEIVAIPLRWAVRMNMLSVSVDVKTGPDASFAS